MFGWSFFCTDRRQIYESKEEMLNLFVGSIGIGADDIGFGDATFDVDFLIAFCVSLALPAQSAMF